MSKPLRVIESLSRDALTNGHQHGETFRHEIKDLAEIRLERMCSLSSYKRQKDVLDLAERHLPILQKFDKNLMAEFQGISESSGVSLAHLVVLNHYTDMRDITPEGLSSNEDLGGC